VESQSLPSAVFLDLDDTIIDFSRGVDTCWLLAFEEVAAEVPKLVPDQLKQALDVARDAFWANAESAAWRRLNLREASRRIVEESLLRNGVEVPGLAKRIAYRYRDLRDDGLELVSGAIEILETLRAGGTALALLTNGSAVDQRAKVDRFRLGKYFDYICIEGDAGFGKPDTRVFNGALTAVGASPYDTWMVGDNLEADVFGAMNLGIKGIWVDGLNAGLPPGVLLKPNRIIRNLAELLQ
jgi:putative hydrolase of the HAD superfamily